MELILNKNEKSKVIGQIYKITNLKTNKIYIGQTRSHYLNKDKLRPFGYLKRFDNHISEAIKNTKKNQCLFLNNSIRKYGVENFKVELIQNCNLDELNELETKFIKQFNSIYPNGYNLTIGGKSFSKNKIDNNSKMNVPRKRGHEFGYKHSEETKIKMSIRSKEFCKKRDTNKIIDSLIDYYDNKKIEKLLNYPELFSKSNEEIINCVKDGNNKIKNYNIRHKKFKMGFYTDKLSLNEKFNKLINILNKVRSILNKGNNG